jgi:hypothetical protein
MTTVSDGLYQYGGVPVGGMFSPGRAIFVRPGTGSDGNNGKSPAKAVKTLAQALLMATANAGDVVYLIAESNTASSTTDYQSATLDWNKDGVHLIGMNCGPLIGQRSRIGQLSTVLTVNSLFKVSANNCLIANIEVFQGVASSTATTPIAVEVTGQRNLFQNCQISGIGDTSMDVSGARSLKISGSENTFKHCYIGLDTVIRATTGAETEVADSTARTVFEDCMFDTYTSNSSLVMVKYAAPDRFILFKNCTINAVNNITSAVSPTVALSAPSTINGQIIFHHSCVSGFTDVIAAGRVFISAAAGSVADMGLATNYS